MRHGQRRILCGVVGLLGGLAWACAGADAPQDADADGVPDAIELRLGTDPARAEARKIIWDAPPSASTERPAALTPGRDLRRVSFANVAGNRSLWVLEFAGDFEFPNTNLLVYVDADNNPKRGQRDKALQGADFVLWLSDGGRGCHGYSITGEGAARAPTRFEMLGKQVLISTDMRLAQESDESRLRFLVRCQELEPRADAVDTGWIAVAGPAQGTGNTPPILAVGDVSASTADTDNDGLTDSVEAQLGTDPGTAEALDVIFDSAQAKNAEVRKKKLAEAPERTISRILFGNAGADRFLWRVEFGADYPSANSNFILYVDTDNAPNTGRKGMGCEVMLSMGNGSSSTTAFSPTGENVTGSATRAAIVGKSLYLCADLPLKQENGKSVYRVTALSEMRDPAKGVDSTDWFAAQGAGVSERKTSFGLDDCSASEGVAMTRGLDLFRALKADPANAVVKIGNCAFEGFEYDLAAEYKELSALRTVPRGRILAPVPKDGRYHIGFLLYDQGGTEKVELRLGDARLGVALADEDDNRTKLFFTTDKVAVKAGDTVELCTPSSSGNYRIEDILFLAKPPEVRPRVLELTDMEVTPAWDGDAVKPGVVRVTWITTWPAKCTVSCGERSVTEPEAVANHRVYLDGLPETQPCELQVTAPKPGDKGAVTASAKFTTAPPVVKSALDRVVVPLPVANPSRDAVVDWPVTCGVPFAKGALDSTTRLRLLDPNGGERPLQATTSARWPDGSLKWALLNFRADVPAAGSAAYAIECGASVARAAAPGGLTVDESPERVLVTTGPLRLEVSRKVFAIPGRVWLDRDGNGSFSDDELMCGAAQAGQGTLVDDGGKEFGTGTAPEEVVVEERGPERVVVLVKGHHAAGDGAKHFAVEMRVMAYAGRKFLRVFHTFGNDVTSSDFTAVRSLTLGLPLEGGAETFELATDADAPLSGRAESAPALFQDLDSHFSLTCDGKTTEGKRAAGWVRVTGPRGTMTVALRDFWQLYPKAVTVGKDGVRLGLMPPLKDDQYAEQSKDPVQLVHLYYNLQGGRYKFRQGQSKTHEMLLSFEADTARAGLDAFQRGVVAAAPSAWVCGSLALGEVPPTGTAWASRFDAQMAKGSVSYLTARDRRSDYGMMNYGDWWGERVYNWGNIEYDDAHVWMVDFARTGDLNSFTAGDRAAKHYADVDCIHYHSDPRRVGAGYSHCLGHVGGWFKENPVEGGSLGGGHSPCHTRAEGLVEHYLLTGDRRSLDAALGIANRYDGWWLNNYDMSNCRVPGWHMVLTMGVYQATSDPFYLNAAKIIARRAIERQAPDGGWKRNLVPGHCFCLPRHRGEAGFMFGVMLDGLKYYHEATGDPRAADAIVRGAKYLIAETYDPVAKQFRYTTCPFSPIPSSTGNMACEGFAYAVRLSGDSDLLRVTRDTVDQIVQRANGGATSVVRFVPRAIYDLDRLGPSPYSVAGGQGFELLAYNPRGEDFTVTPVPAGANASVEVTSPSGKKLSANSATPATGAKPAVVAVLPSAPVYAGNGEKGVYRVRVIGAGSAVTSLDGEVVSAQPWVGLDFPGSLRLEVVAPPQGTAKVLFRGSAKGEYKAVARPLYPQAPTTEKWRVRKTPSWTGVKLPAPPKQGWLANEPLICRIEVEGPAGILEVRMDGMPAYISAPSGKSFCPARPVAAFRSSVPLLPGSAAQIALDASPSIDADNDIVDWAWTYDDGTQASGRQVTRDLKQLEAAVKPGAPREFKAKLTVRDTWGYTDAAEQTLRFPPTWFLGLDPNATVTVEAESFTGQGGGGEVRVYERPGSSGKMITYWHEVIGHWLEWKVDVPKAGDYRVVLKYASDCDSTTRDLTIDGAAPGDAFKTFVLPRTGGFCSTRDDWAYYMIGGAAAPATVPLAAGPHTLRMNNLQDGCALDFILLTPK